MAEPVLARLSSYVAEYERGGHTAQSSAVDHTERARDALARLVNADPKDLALNRNATDGINWIAACFALNAGDEVITSTEEHPAMVLPWLAACQRTGARLRFVAPSADPLRFADNLGGVLNERTRLVAMSQVSCETGTRVPVHLLRDIVGPDVAVLVDGAQSVGQFPIDVPLLRADFFIGNGHKWLCGPKGTGFAWFNPASLHLAPPAYFASDAVEPGWSRTYYQLDHAPHLELSSSAHRFEFGTRAWHLHGGLADAIDYQTGLGWDNIEAHMSAMSGKMKAALAEIGGVTVHSPERWEVSSGLVTFSLAGIDGVTLSRRLWDDHKIAQRRVEVPSAVRVSAAYFASDRDIDRLIDAVRRLSIGG
jgi:selenocysteine lyase/cysteine desulfurase